MTFHCIQNVSLAPAYRVRSIYLLSHSHWYRGHVEHLVASRYPAFVPHPFAPLPPRHTTPSRVARGVHSTHAQPPHGRGGARCPCARARSLRNSRAARRVRQAGARVARRQRVPDDRILRWGSPHRHAPTAPVQVRDETYQGAQKCARVRDVDISKTWPGMVQSGEGPEAQNPCGPRKGGQQKSISIF